MALNTNQATVGTSAVLLIPARSTRRVAIVRNSHASNLLYVGGSSGVTTANGLLVPAGQAVELPGHETEVWAIASAASTTVAWADVAA
jgi:hypothetical protein